ncbi:MAG: HlyD family type I secretion periplasmic adaptor subunit [Azoarcus sp.]|nr:HlyD family type I secretion periplasmic adaptor subunit [Azoarcus sp.]
MSAELSGRSSHAVVVSDPQTAPADKRRRGALAPARVTEGLVSASRPREIGAPRQSRDEGDDLELLTDTRSPARLGFWALAIGFGGFMLWAAFAPLNEGVPTSGVVTIDTKRKAVQHLSGGIVNVVHVKEGQIVKEGDPLLEIDPATTRANYESARQNYYALRATEARLVAEQNGLEGIEFHSDLLDAQDDPLVASMLANQESLFQSRSRSQEAEISGMEESIASRTAQLKLLREQLQGVQSLVNDGFAPRNQMLELQRQSEETAGAIAEFRMRIQQRQQEYRKEVDAQLAEVRGKVDAERDRFRALGNDLAHTVIRAPASGQVVGLAAQTVGGVISPGQKVMDIVPADELLLLETQVPPHLIDRVHAGLEADVRFSAFANSPMLVVKGKVESISGDLLINEQTGAGYFLARVSVTGEGSKELGSRRLQAGMPAEVVIITGERSLLTYLLHPLLKRIAFSMKEE